jgi:hypothetical protein
MARALLIAHGQILELEASLRAALEECEQTREAEEDERERDRRRGRPRGDYIDMTLFDQRLLQADDAHLGPANTGINWRTGRRWGT